MVNNTRDIDKADASNDELREINTREGFQILPDPDPLDCYEFERRDDFALEDWDGETDKLWRVVGREWRFRVSWIPDRDNIPTRDAHRIYRIRNHETWDDLRVSEAELMRERWELVEVDE